MDVEEEAEEEEDDDVEEENRSPRPGNALCVSLRSRNAHGHFKRVIYFVWKFTEKWLRTPPSTSFCASICHKGHFVWKFKGKVPDAYPGHGILCEPAQSKRTWTFHKSLFVYKFTGEMPLGHRFVRA